jgi:hypothetical protein
MLLHDGGSSFTEQPHDFMGSRTTVNFQRSEGQHLAKQWNAEHPTSQGVGFVTIFRVRAEFLSKYEKHSAGGTAREEYWIPAAELAEFNRNIIGRIEVIAKYERAAR